MFYIFKYVQFVGYKLILCRQLQGWCTI